MGSGALASMEYLFIVITPRSTLIGSNGNEEVLHTPSELEPHHQMQVSVILRELINLLIYFLWVSE